MPMIVFVLNPSQEQVAPLQEMAGRKGRGSIRAKRNNAADPCSPRHKEGDSALNPNPSLPPFFWTTTTWSFSIVSFAVVQSPQVICNPESCGASSGYIPLRYIRR